MNFQITTQIAKYNWKGDLRIMRRVDTDITD